MLRIHIVLCLLAAAACSSRSTTRSSAESGAVAQAPITTSGAIARRNLDARIAGLERAGRRAALVDLLLARAEFFGSFADYDRALNSAEDGVELAPDDAAAYQLRGRVRSRLHRWDEALADFDRAEQLGDTAAALAPHRAAIMEARGRVAQARTQRALTTPSPTGRAALARAAGNRVHAVEQYEDALRRHRGVSPFPVAWLYMQLGLLHEELGDDATARASYQAAVERLPGYHAATVHLAELEHRIGANGDAAARLRPLLEVSDDPEIAGHLAAWTGDAELLARATAGFSDLEQRHQLAIAHHAAEFWRNAGADPQRAQRLTAIDAANRRPD